MSNSEDEDEAFDEISDLSELPAKARGTCNFQVSGWDDDDEGIDEERNPSEDTEKAFFSAAENGHLDVLRKILESHPSVVHSRDKDGYSPLHRACYNGHDDIVKALLDAGSRLDAETNDQWQPLHSACRWNNVKCASLLISYGADVNAKSQGGVTPLHLAAGHAEGVDVVQMLVSHPDIILNPVDSSGDTPEDLARRCGPNHFIFEAAESCFREENIAK